MIDNCTSHRSSQTGRDEGVTGEETEGKRGNLGGRQRQRGGGLGGNDWRHMLALKQDRVRQRGGRCRTKREGHWDMKTKRETERRGCWETRLIAALGHVTEALFIVSQPRRYSPGIFRMLVVMEIGKNVKCTVWACRILNSNRVYSACVLKANTATVSDSWVTLFPISLIRSDRMGLARPVKQQMFCSNVTSGLPEIPSGGACVWSWPSTSFSKLGTAGDDETFGHNSGRTSKI